MATMYFAQDGNYGDAADLVTLDLDTLGFPVVDIFDAVDDSDRAELAKSLVENARAIRLSRSLLGTDIPNGDDPAEAFPEYFRGQAELVRDMLGSELIDIEDVENLLCASPEA